MDFEALDSALRSAIRQMGLEKTLKERQCLRFWDEVVGEKLATLSQAEDIRKGVLYVSAKDSIWGQEIFNLKGLIIRKLNEKMGEEIVKDIKVKVKPQRKRKEKEIKKPEGERELDEATIRMIEKITEKIEDEKMRHLLRRTILNYYKARLPQKQWGRK
ncbi:DUF721 domain-containing protein [bacterium]|nr:DUF721 domain-containing protein [bacterium]